MKPRSNRSGHFWVVFRLRAPKAVDQWYDCLPHSIIPVAKGWPRLAKYPGDLPKPYLHFRAAGQLSWTTHPVLNHPRTKWPKNAQPIFKELRSGTFPLLPPALHLRQHFHQYSQKIVLQEMCATVLRLLVMTQRLAMLTKYPVFSSLTNYWGDYVINEVSFTILSFPIFTLRISRIPIDMQG